MRVCVWVGGAGVPHYICSNYYLSACCNMLALRMARLPGAVGSVTSSSTSQMQHMAASCTAASAGALLVHFLPEHCQVASMLLLHRLDSRCSSTAGFFVPGADRMGLWCEHRLTCRIAVPFCPLCPFCPFRPAAHLRSCCTPWMAWQPAQQRELFPAAEAAAAAAAATQRSH